MIHVQSPLDLFMLPPGSPQESITVGISGRAGVGKDTFATMLQQRLEAKGISTEVMGFADPIRTIAAIMGFSLQRELKEVVVGRTFDDLGGSLFDAIEETLGKLLDEDTRAHLYSVAYEYIDTNLVTDNADGTKTITASPRTFMQVLGTEIGQSVDQLLWCKVLFQRAARSICKVVLIPDLRFLHEVPYVDITIFVDRDVPAVAGHVSESYFDPLKAKANVLVDNNHSRDALLISANAVAGMLEKLNAA